MRLPTSIRPLGRVALGALAGAAAGGAYAHFVGCHTGTCLLTSNVWAAAAFFGFTGAVVAAPGPRRAAPAKASSEESATR